MTIGCSQVLNSTQVTDAEMPSTSSRAAWVTGDVPGIARNCSIGGDGVPMAITQPLTLIHWNSAAPKNVSGRPEPLFEGIGWP